MKIVKFTTGLPPREVSQLMVNGIPFNTEGDSFGVSYEVKSTDGETMGSGNLEVSKEDFFKSAENLENIVLAYLELERDLTPESEVEEENTNL